ncbi:MAG: hypothetical protein ACI4GA_07845 [Acutalibacteraceae bacterium]
MKADQTTEAALTDDKVMAQINRLSRKKLEKDEVYIFNITLCDNEIDRDFDVFSEKSLTELAGLFIGKTGISDHSMRSSDQTARIYSTWIEKTPGKLTSYGEPYAALKAGAYMVKTKRNEDLIKEIDAGIKKEVSVGCSVAKSICSVCGRDAMREGCSHRKGRTYDGKICYHTLTDPTDAYEWSFVAVPAQREAGVTKAFKAKEETKVENVKDFFKSQSGSVSVTKSQAESIVSYIESLEKLCEDGKNYRNDLVKQVRSLALITMPEIGEKTLDSLCKAMSTDNLRDFRDGLSKKKNSIMPPQVQLASSGEGRRINYNEYKI